MPAVPDPERERSGTGVPLPPEDRLWRHPSEFGSDAGGGVPLPYGTDEPPRRRRSVVAVAAIAGFIGAVVAVAGLAVVGVLRPRVVEKVERSDQPVVEAASTAGEASPLLPAGVGGLARDARMSVLRVEVGSADGERTGSAVVHDADGTLLTSAALVEGAMAVAVIRGDGRSTPAQVVGSDPVTGLAVLRADVAGLRPTGVAADAEVGTSAVTLAGPAGHSDDPSVTVGVVSAIDVQADTDLGAIRELVQLDRPVPAAADGGLVLDADGRLLGIALDLGTDGTGDQAIGHVVPAGTARQVAADLLDDGRVRRAWLGARGSDLPSERAAELGLPGGVLVEEVQDGSPAAQAGIVPGDVIVALDGRAVRSLDELVVAIHHSPIGEPVEVTSVRDGSRVTDTVTMVESPA